MKLIFVKDKHCPACDSMEKKLDAISFRMKNVTIEKRYLFDRDNLTLPVFIAPALICDGKILSYGDISKRKISELISIHTDQS